MAIPKVKATYSLDVETVRTLDRTARRLGVTKSEALRRAIRATAVAAVPAKESDALVALSELQGALALSPSRALRWEAQTRAERRASSLRRTSRRP